MMNGRCTDTVIARKTAWSSVMGLSAFEGPAAFITGVINAPQRDLIFPEQSSTASQPLVRSV